MTTAPMGSDPATPDPAVPEAGTPELERPEPGNSKSGRPEPGSPEPGSPESGLPDLHAQLERAGQRLALLGRLPEGLTELTDGGPGGAAPADSGPRDTDLAQVHHELSRVHEALGDYQAALRHHQAYALHEGRRRNVRAQASAEQLSLERYQQAGELHRQGELLRDTVADYTAQLEATQVEMTELLASAAEYRDAPLGPHTRWVGEMSEQVALGLGLRPKEARSLSLAARLHDIGKIAIPDAVLLKDSGLSDDEWRVMRTHTTLGARLLARSTSPLLRLASSVAMSHHEAWDGSGYPQGLSGEEIPLAGRIVAVVDAFDALVSDRPYKAAWSPRRALAYLQQLSGTQFDPHVVDVFSALYEGGQLPSGH